MLLGNLVSVSVGRAWSFAILSHIHNWECCAPRITNAMVKMIIANVKALEGREVQDLCAENSVKQMWFSWRDSKWFNRKRYFLKSWLIRDEHCAQCGLPSRDSENEHGYFIPGKTDRLFGDAMVFVRDASFLYLTGDLWAASMPHGWFW